VRADVRPTRAMSISAAQASKFYEQVVRDGKVFTLEDPEGFLVFPIRDLEVIPFWSSRSRVEKIQSTMPEYACYSIHEKPFNEFYEQTLPWLEEHRIHVGVNWSGERLSGYDVPVSDLRANLEYWMKNR
jgi:NADPH:quinone reductase-like Zn-dependent oxidoreductase